MTLAAIVLAASILGAEAAPPADLPYQPWRLPRQREALIAPHFAVAAAHPRASAAGADILRAGGSAADAALAVQAMLALVEPEGSGPGGGCFILFHDAATGRLTALDGREEIPAGARPDMFLTESGEIVEDPFSGGLPVGVPGTLAAMCELHRRHGRLPLEIVLAPALEAAEEGVPVSRDLAWELRRKREKLIRFPATAALYYPDGEPLREGELLRNPGYARFLRRWRDDPSGRFLYEGEIAAAIARTVREAPFQPGFLVEEDLAAYRVLEREPVFGDYRGWKIGAMPPPTSGGITLLEMLGILDRLEPLPADPFDDAVLIEHLDRLARASRLAYADRGAYLGDPDASPRLDMRALLDPSFLDRRTEQLHAPGDTLGLPAAPAPLDGHTTHFSIVDGQGNMIACTTTIEQLMGSGMVVEGWGFLLNNQLSDFNWLPSDPPAPNDARPERVERVHVLGEAPAGGKRPRSSMCPVILYDPAGRPRYALGSPGGSRIIGTVACVVTGLLDFDLDLQAAVSLPRLHSRGGPLDLETGGWNRAALAGSLSARGWPARPLDRWPTLQGDVQAVGILPDGRRQGAGDPRHDGLPAGG